MIKLTNKEKILLHLLDYRRYKDRYEFPIEVTQQGISDTIKISISHVPRNLQSLMDSRFLNKKKGHVIGKKRRMSVYFLTNNGISEALSIKNYVMKQIVNIDDNKKTIEDILKDNPLNLLDIILSVEKEGDVDIKDGPKVDTKKKYISFFEMYGNIKLDYFVDRKEELNKVLNWYAMGKRVLIVKGSNGIGKSFLIRKMLKLENPKMNILWLNIQKNRSLESILSSINVFFKELEKETVPLKSENIAEIVSNKLSNINTLLILDGYYLVEDEVVDFFTELVNIDDSLRIITTMRDNTPFYNRFYTLADIENGKIEELKIEGFDFETTKEMFADTDKNALKKIYQITKGNPQILVSLKDNNEEALKEHMMLTNEQIRLLFFLKDIK